MNYLGKQDKQDLQMLAGKFPNFWKFYSSLASYEIKAISVNTLRPRQNGCHFADDILKWIFLNENVWISIKISLKFVLKGPINNIPALVQIMAWRQPGDNPLSEPMMVSLLTHICVTRPQWVKVKWRQLSLTTGNRWLSCPSGNKNFQDDGKS